MKTSHRLATAIAAASCVAASSPAWAQTRFLEGAVSFDYIRMTATAIDPDGPAPGVMLTRAPRGFLHNELCFVPDSCQQVNLYDQPERPDSSTMPLHSSIGYLGSSSSVSVAPDQTSATAHIEFTEGTKQNKGQTGADLLLPGFEVLPNTFATFSVRLHGGLSATNPDFPYYGSLLAFSQFVQPYGFGEPQFTLFQLVPRPIAQLFDQRMTAYVRNDTEQVEQAWWDLRSGFELQLLVPEPSSWLMLLAGLGVLAASGNLRRGLART
ncbi:PEP-CTERM sorting domain-containing protein [Pseudoduganella eburnea]|uniref:PEP-CTERM sorting domain-containing protein n=1 Tax=Massilia eburnea TaxID=1776165 RepID=A0A6L6QB41_9BURK|nr:PEP-CTERM sorting domain-containing protein [Massilia eburnea]MTW09672.1 PEP-CTERM sorting domain-containing protein [Massilia eburnea]